MNEPVDANTANETDAAPEYGRRSASPMAQPLQMESPMAQSMSAASLVAGPASPVVRPTSPVVVPSWPSTYLEYTSLIDDVGLWANGRENGPLSSHAFLQLDDELQQQVSPHISVFGRLVPNPPWSPRYDSGSLHFSQSFINEMRSSQDLQSRDEKLPVSTSSTGENHGGRGEEHTKTAPPAATSVSRPDARHYILELANKIANSLTSDVDAKELLKSRHAFPELIEGCSVKFGLKSGSQIDRDVMYFVNKHQR